MEGIFHIWVLCRLPLPVLHLLFLDQVGHHQICANGNVLWLHGNHLLQLFLYDRHNWLLCVLDICAANICCGQDRLMEPCLQLQDWLQNGFTKCVCLPMCELLFFAAIELTLAGKAICCWSASAFTQGAGMLLHSSDMDPPASLTLRRAWNRHIGAVARQLVQHLTATDITQGMNFSKQVLARSLI